MLDRLGLETGRRSSVSVEEMLALAFMLDVAPVHLLLPVDEAFYAATPTLNISAHRVREWVRGNYPLPGVDPRVSHSEVPESEWQPPPPMSPDQQEAEGLRAEYLSRLRRDRQTGPKGDDDGQR